MEESIFLHGFVFPVFQLCLLLIIICLTIALLSKKDVSRIISLQIVCLFGGLGLGLAACVGFGSFITLPGSVLLLIAFGVSIGRNGRKS